MTGPGVPDPEVLEPAAVVGTAWLAERFPVNSVDLFRWHRAGIVPAYSAGKGSGSRATWPAWSARVVALLVDPAHESVGGTVRRAYLDLVRRAAVALAADPDAPWVVLGDDGRATVHHDAAAVVEALGPWQAPVVVSPPSLESVACSA